MTSLSLDPAGRTDLDLACVAAGRCTLWRQGGEVRLAVDDAAAGAVRRALSLRGVRTSVSDAAVPREPRSLAAIGIGLGPVRLADPGESDVLEVRVVPLSEATAALTGRRAKLWPLRGRRRDRCRALLAGTDALLEVRRSASCGRATLAAARHALRPVLFDRAATPRPLRVYAADGALTRWLNG